MQDGFILSLRITKKKKTIYYLLCYCTKKDKKKNRASMYVRRCMCGMYVRVLVCQNERKKERRRVKEKSYIVVTVYAWVDVIRASTLAIKHATNVTNELYFHFKFSICDVEWYYLSRISLNRRANWESTLIESSRLSSISKSSLSNHVGGSTCLDGRGHNNLSAAAHTPHQVRKFNGSEIFPKKLLKRVCCSSVSVLPIASWRASWTSFGEMYRPSCKVSSWNLMKARPYINFLPEFTKTCLLR